jgi:predicted XRE-type DNA-binding protein
VLHAFMKKSKSGIGLPKPDAELIETRLKRARALDAEDERMAEIPVRKSSGNVFADIGFSRAETAELTAKSRLIQAIAETIKRRKLTQLEAARRCRTDQPTLSKVLRGRMESVTIDRLAAWLTSLGRTVEIRVRPYDAKAKTGHLLTAL